MNLANVFLNSSGASATIGINSPGLSADLPFGRSEYRFGIRVTDEIVMGVSSYAEASIKLIGVNNKAPIPMVKFYSYSLSLFYGDFSRCQNVSRKELIHQLI